MTNIHYTNEAGESILDPAGRPFKKAELTEEFATPRLTGIRSPWNSSVAAVLTPQRLASLLVSSAEGNEADYITLAEEMEERDPHLASVLGTRKRAVAQLPITVEAASDDAAHVLHADAVTDLTKRPEFEDLLIDALDALGKGWSIVELGWNRQARIEQRADLGWRPDDYIWRDQRWFQWDDVTGHTLLMRDEAHPQGIELPKHKFVIHRPKLKSGVPLRGGLARLAAFAFMCKSYTLRDWMGFAEVFGMPLRVGKYGPNANDRDVSILRSAVANIGTDAAAVIPDSMRIEFEQAVAASGGHQLFEGLANWLDKQVSKAVLGQTMTSDDGSSKSQAEVHDNVRTDLRDFDARQLAKTLNRQVVKPFIDLNWGPQDKYPEVQLYIEEMEDLEPWMNAVGQAVDRGAKVEASQVLDRLGIADADEQAEAEGKLLRPVGAAAPAPADTATKPAAPDKAVPNERTGEAALNRLSNALEVALNRQQPDAIGALANDASGDWQALVGPMLAPIRREIATLLDEGGTLDDLIDRLDQLLPDMNIDALTHSLATAQFQARAEGDVRDA